MLSSTCILLPEKSLTLMLHLRLALSCSFWGSEEREVVKTHQLWMEDSASVISDRAGATFLLILFACLPQARYRHTIGSGLPGSVSVAPKMTSWTLGVTGGRASQFRKDAKAGKRTGVFHF